MPGKRRAAAPGFSDAAPAARRARPAAPAFSDGPRRTAPTSPAFSSGGRSGSSRSRPSAPAFSSGQNSRGSSGGDRNRVGRNLSPTPTADDKYRSRQSKRTGSRFQLQRGKPRTPAAAPIFQAPGERRAATAPVFSSTPRTTARRTSSRASGPTFQGS